jgi:cytochrome c5
MTRLICIVAAGCLLLSACEKKETTQTPATKPPETTAAPPAQPSPAQPPAEGTPAVGAGQPQLPGIEQVTQPIDLATGAKIYEQACATCHREGIAGAPKMGDPEAWKERIAQGAQTLVQNSIQGYQGSQGVMPPKGGVESLSDAEVASAAVYMAMQSSGGAPQ